MKILITGFNKNQCTKDYYLQQQLQVVPSHYSLIRCLEDMGYEVEQRVHSIGENLDQYEHVIVYIHSVGAFTHYLYSGLDAIYQRQNCILAFDDWQFDQIIKSIIRYKKELSSGDWDKAFRNYLIDMWKGPETKEELIKLAPHFEKACDIILEKKNKLLVTAFDKGNLDLLNLEWPKELIYRYNPNPYHLNRTPENNYCRPTNTMDSFFSKSEQKREEWNFASLVQNKTRKWLEKHECRWPIKYYGGMRGKYKSERLKEGDMCEEYSSQWGILMPGYYHAGSGWWRARPLQVADAGSILLGDVKEMRVTHGKARYNGKQIAEYKASDIEKLSRSQRAAFAAAQKDALYYEHPLDKSVQRNEIALVLSDV